MDINIHPETVSADLRAEESESRPNLSKARQLAFNLFKEKRSVEEVAKSVKRAQSTTIQYLVEYIKREKISDPYPWVNEPTFVRVADVARQIGDERIKPIFDWLNGQIDYAQIRISLACLRNKD